MLGKLVAAFIGEKIMARSGRGGAGAVVGAATAAAARRGIGPLATVIAAGYGLKKLNDYHKARRT